MEEEFLRASLRAEEARARRENAREILRHLDREAHQAEREAQVIRHRLYTQGPSALDGCVTTGDEPVAA